MQRLLQRMGDLSSQQLPVMTKDFFQRRLFSFNPFPNRASLLWAHLERWCLASVAGGILRDEIRPSPSQERALAASERQGPVFARKLARVLQWSAEFFNFQAYAPAMVLTAIENKIAADGVGWLTLLLHDSPGPGPG